MIGWFVLFPPEFTELGKHAAGGAGFVSNFVLWSETGYFDSKNKLLLHLWSLGVEEQFYIFWPFLLVVAWKRRWNMALTILTIAALSFALNIWTVLYSDRNLAFYSPPTRLWELLAGSLLAWREIRIGPPPLRPVLRELASGGGLALIAASLLTVTQDMPWPGWLALVPVASTILIVGPGRSSAINRVLLGNRGIVAIGLISYPLYLWHWPLLVFGRLINEAQVPRTGRFGIVALSFVLAWATYKFVEKPIRFGKQKRRSAAILLPLIAGMALVGLAVSTGHPEPRMYAAYHEVVTGPEELAHSAYFNRSATDINVPTLPGDSLNTIALVGDSHVIQYWPRFQEINHSRQRVELLAYGACPPFLAAVHVGIAWDGMPFRCGLFHKIVMAKVQRPVVRTVVYAACWDCYFDGRQLYLADDPQKALIGRTGVGIDSLYNMFEREVRQLIEMRKRVFIVLPSANLPSNDPRTMLPRRLPGLAPKSFPRFVSRSAVDSVSGFVQSRLTGIAARTGAVVIDPVAAICHRAECPLVTEDGKAIFFDTHHLRAEYVRRHADFMDVVFNSGMHPDLTR